MTDQERHIAVWQNCLQIIESNVDPQQFNTWFKPIRPISLVEAKLTVEVPSDFFREYIEGAYKDLLRLTIRRAIGGKIKWYGLENSLVITEYVPLVISHTARTELIREE